MIIVTGAKGQLGTDVVLELEKLKIEHIGIDIEDLDITDSEAVDKYFKELNARTDPAVQKSVIHCAAYTAVDKAEDEPELCFKVNAEGTENIAKACRETNAEMIYISTDYVFNGEGEQPFETDAPKEALSTYGKSKLAGEEAVVKHLEKHYIVRISWVFGENGPNFVKTMLRLADEGKNEISVVCDQIGSPTYTPDLSKLLCDMALSGKYGVYHATNEGFCSWAEFAEQIMRLRAKINNIKERENGAEEQQNSSAVTLNVEIKPITTAQYPTKAKRPKNSRLSKKSLDAAGFERLPTWQNALERYLTISN